MTTTETQTTDTAAIVTPTMTHVPAQNAVRGTVTDCPKYTWDNSDQPAIIDLRERFGIQWVSDHREDLDDAAISLIGDHLLAEWRRRGYEPSFMDDTAAYEDLARIPSTDPSDETYWAVWDEAAYAVTADQLIDKANLRAYAHP